MWLIVLVLVVLTSTDVRPARADVTYAIILTDDQSDALQEQTRLFNAAPILGKGPKPPDLTPAQFLERSTQALVNGWSVGHHETSARKSWPDLTSQEKLRVCRRQKMSPCPN